MKLLTPFYSQYSVKCQHTEGIQAICFGSLSDGTVCLASSQRGWYKTYIWNWIMYMSRNQERWTLTTAKGMFFVFLPSMCNSSLINVDPIIFYSLETWFCSFLHYLRPVMKTMVTSLYGKKHEQSDSHTVCSLKPCNCQWTGKPVYVGEMWFWNFANF